MLLEKQKKRHGGVLAVTDEELALLERFFDHKKPVVEGLFADPDLACFDGTYYLYPTTDGFTDWSGTKFSVFASKDLRKFQKAADIFDMADGDVPWAVGSAWRRALQKKMESITTISVESVLMANPALEQQYLIIRRERLCLQQNP